MALGPIAARILATQVAVSAVFALGWWFAGGPRDALAALAGGACIVLPGAYFAVKMLSRGPGSRPEDMLGTFYTAAAVRLVMAVVLLFILVPVFTDALVPLLTTLVAALAVHWFALLWKG